jgi:hypothetical protein
VAILILLKNKSLRILSRLAETEIVSNEDTLMPMILISFTGFGANRFRSHTLEHHEKLITGIVLVGLGILAFIMEF